jgi:hypothetical protein
MSEQGKIRGWIESRSGQGRLRNITFDPAAKELKFTFRGEFGSIDYKATVDGDDIKGSLNMSDEFSMQFEGSRESKDVKRFEPPPAADTAAATEDQPKATGATDDAPALPSAGG